MKGKVQQPGSACSGKTSVRSACHRSGRVKGKAKTGKRRVKVKATGIRYEGSRTLSQTDTYMLKMMIWYGVPSTVIHLALTVIRACNLDHSRHCITLNTSLASRQSPTPSRLQGWLLCLSSVTET